jgi:membrane protease YdiL (CAAX protease family)
MTPNDRGVRPISIWGSLILFGIPTALMWVATRWAIPALRNHLAGPDILCWFVAGGAVFVCLFVAALVAFWSEPGGFTLDRFSDRFRFRRISAADVAWSLGTLVACGLLAAGIAGLWRLAAQASGVIPQPQLSPPFVRMEPLRPDTQWVLLAWLPLFFFNIAGEELWWRGYLLPRQEQKHGSAAAVVHGLGLTLFHLPLGVDLTMIVLPFLFGLPYVVQRRKSLWTGFVVHGILNGGGFLAVAFGLV